MKFKWYIPVIIFFTPIVLFLLLLGGCKVTKELERPTVKKATKAAYKLVNPNVKYVGGDVIETKEEWDVFSYIYQFEDERGIPFTIEAQDQMVMFVQAECGYDGRDYKYASDYRRSVIAYYEEDALKEIEKLNYTKLHYNDAHSSYIEIEFLPDEDVEKIADVIMNIDEIFSFDERYCTLEDYPKYGDKRWADSRAHDDIIIRFCDKGGTYEYVEKRVILSNSCQNCQRHNLDRDTLVNDLSRVQTRLKEKIDTYEERQKNPPDPYEAEREFLRDIDFELPDYETTGDKIDEDELEQKLKDFPGYETGDKIVNFIVGIFKRNSKEDDSPQQ